MMNTQNRLLPDFTVLRLSMLLRLFTSILSVWWKILYNGGLLHLSSQLCAQ